MPQFRLSHQDRRGLTLVELLVVIAVIGILFGLLLPAVMSARSSGRRSQCANNLRQLGSAVHQFHERHGTMPPYWGGQQNAGGQMFGPWIMHLLPDLGEQAFYDRFQPSTTGSTVVEGAPIRGAETCAAVPPSTDPVYRAPTYNVTTTQIGVFTETAVGISISGTIYDVRATMTDPGQGTPGRAAEFDWTPGPRSFLSHSNGLHVGFNTSQSAKSLDVLQCGDDASDVSPNTMWQTAAASGTSRGNVPWSLTNYMANAHVFMKFNGGRILSGSTATPLDAGMGGRFPRALGAQVVGLPPTAFHHAIAGTVGLGPRQFAHIADGLSNTIMFGEGMRRCDDGNSMRYAFLPTNQRGDEHSFGIDVTVSGTSTSLAQWGDINMAYGNTLMFQQRPPLSGCNKYRLQANHDVLNVAMCDGSVRGISPRVTRREQCDPDVAGREYGRDTYNPTGLGGVLITGAGAHQFRDGIWDMLMVPNDPPTNVLSNTGEIGKEK